MIALSLLLAACSGAEPPPPPPVPEEAPAPSTDVNNALPDGPLNGLTVYVSAGHGFAADARGEGFQRLEAEAGITEDLWTAAFANTWLIPGLEAEGARILSAREADPHAVANTAAPVEIEGLSHSEWPAPEGIWEREEAVARLGVDGVATWRVPAPSAEPHRVYARWISATNADSAATYIVRSGERVVKTIVDQRLHGNEWIPLATVSDAGTVEVILVGSGEGTLSADQIKVGGGTHTIWIPRDDLSEEHVAWELAGAHILRAYDAPTYVWQPPGTGVAFDATTRARWADWSHPDGEEAALISLHTNAGGASGSMMFVRNACLAGPDCTPRAQSSTRLSALVGEGIADVMREHDAGWKDFGTRNNDLAEINQHINPGMPAVLVEFGFHDHVEDAALLTDPAVQEALADAVVAAFIRWRSGGQPQATAPFGSQ